MDVIVEEPGKNNVHNNAFYAEERLLKSELEAMRDCNPLSARHWIVSSFFHLKEERKQKIPIFSWQIFPPVSATVVIVLQGQSVNFSNNIILCA